MSTRRPPKPPISPEDEALWHEETAQDKKLGNKPAVPSVLPETKTPLSYPEASVSIPAVGHVPAAPAPYLSHGEIEGLDRKRRAKLREEKPEGRLDLHGMTQDAAHTALEAFILRMHAEGRRHLLIITGKGPGGDGVLKRAVPQWLNSASLRPLLLGFEHAPKKLGGEGALLVLLRKPR